MKSFLEVFLSNEALEILDHHLTHHSYVSGFQVSEADVILVRRLPLGLDFEQFPALQRWKNHVSALGGFELVSLSEDELKSLKSKFGNEDSSFILLSFFYFINKV